MVVPATSGLLCDVVLVDGDHKAAAVYRDVSNFRRLAACGAWLLADDTLPERGGAGEALEKLAAEGFVEVVRRFSFNRGQHANQSALRCQRDIRGRYTFCPPVWGFSIARYTPLANCSARRGP